MDGQGRAKRPPRDLRREFVGCRLESQVLIRAYELAVPMVRRRIVAELPQVASAATGSWDRAGLVAQGA
jgi:hypothetical protein